MKKEIRIYVNDKTKDLINVVINNHLNDEEVYVYSYNLEGPCLQVNEALEELTSLSKKLKRFFTRSY